MEQQIALSLELLRHSAAHLMAQAVARLHPGTCFGVGPAIVNGFYYDMDVPGGLSEDALPEIEAEMRRIVQEDLPIHSRDVDKAEALAIFARDPYKQAIIADITDAQVRLYTQGEFTDLCRGPHVESTGQLRAFRLLSVAGAYWRGNEKNPMLTRVYGTAFASEEELERYLEQVEEAKRRDHRKLGQELGLFSLHEEAPGLPFWLPNGVLLKQELLRFMRETLAAADYEEIETPTILRERLWETSGHLQNYQENMFFTHTVEDERFALKPMNCPGGMLYYREKRHSYRDLPLRVSEFGKVHRFERSGQLHGLLRVRGFTQDDAHIFMTPEQAPQEITYLLELMDFVYSCFGFAYQVELSTRPEKAIGSEEFWELATQSLQTALDARGLAYQVNEGDGAFYGPKIDFHLKDALGRTHQCGTIQMDVNLPERFDLNYIGPDGKEHRVFMLHRAIYGSLERFIAILMEHYGGKFPLWLAPVQARVLPVSEKFLDYAKSVYRDLRQQGVRVTLDDSNEKLGQKIRNAILQKTPYILIVGEKEQAASQKLVSVRARDEGDLGNMEVSRFIALILEKKHSKN